MIGLLEAISPHSGKGFAALSECFLFDRDVFDVEGSGDLEIPAQSF